MKRLTFVSIFLVLLATLLPQAQSEPLADTNRVGLDKDLIYFVMTDRYKDGDTSNDKLAGFDPTNTAFFHGGDLKGLIGNCSPGDDGLARIKSLGFTAVWLTPLVVQQAPTSNSAGYHGYWGVDFTNVDPHLGSNADLDSLSQCAKKLGLKLILDVVTNHTGDIIRYNEKTAYIPEELKSAKSPAWLNDITNYHNVGDMSRCWGDGSCMQLGDFYGLDDVATEKPVVYQGWADVYGDWIKRYGFAGFRVDTARHVDDLFFQRWSPLIQDAAHSVGQNNFTIFGEVWEQNPIALMPYIRVNKLQTALDFPFQNFAVDWASGNSDASIINNLFSYDDIYTSAQSSAYDLVTFLGNHDMGRAAFLIEGKKLNPESQLLPRVKLAHALMYLSRGIPTVYYGDEVGMTGTGNGSDQLARQDMFSTSLSIWKKEKRVGTPSVGNGDSFALTKSSPIAQYLEQLSNLRKNNPALANGQMQVRYAKGPIFAFSKLADGEKSEYLVLLNNSAKVQTAQIQTASTGPWKAIFGTGAAVSKGNAVSVKVPALTATVFKSAKNISDSKITLKSLKIKEDFLTGFVQADADVATNDLAKAEFLIRKVGESKWTSLGTDLGRPFSVYINPSDYSGRVEVMARVTNSQGKSYEFKPTAFTITAP